MQSNALRMPELTIGRAFGVHRPLHGVIFAMLRGPTLKRLRVVFATAICELEKGGDPCSSSAF
jgi:hypothetical protein